MVDGRKDGCMMDDDGWKYAQVDGNTMDVWMDGCNALN